MTSSDFPELFLSLTIQRKVVLLNSQKLPRKCSSSESADQLWRICHVIVLMLVASGVFLAHIRLLPTSDDDILLVWIVALTQVRTGSPMPRFLWIAGVSVLAFRMNWSLITKSLVVSGTKDFHLRSEISVGDYEHDNHRMHEHFHRRKGL